MKNHNHKIKKLTKINHKDHKHQNNNQPTVKEERLHKSHQMP